MCFGGLPVGRDQVRGLVLIGASSAPRSDIRIGRRRLGVLDPGRLRFGPTAPDGQLPPADPRVLPDLAQTLRKIFAGFLNA
jgi:hypothetical protein